MGSPYGRIGLAGGILAYTDPHSTLRAFDRDTGKCLWHKAFPSALGWLHAQGEVFVVGGWRGYTDLFALDALTGDARWTLPAKGEGLHSTRVHTDSASLVIAEAAEGGRLRVHDLVTGALTQIIPLPGPWAARPLEWASPSSAPGDPLIFKISDARLAALSGSPLTPRFIDLPVPVTSQEPRLSGDRLPFTTSGRRLAVFRAGQVRVYDDVWTQWPWLTPFASLDDRRFAYATSEGLVGIIDEEAGPVARVRIGKRVGTALHKVGDVLILGSWSGEVVGLEVRSGWGV